MKKEIRNKSKSETYSNNEDDQYMEGVYQDNNGAIENQEQYFIPEMTQMDNYSRYGDNLTGYGDNVNYNKYGFVAENPMGNPCLENIPNFYSRANSENLRDFKNFEENNTGYEDIKNYQEIQNYENNLKESGFYSRDINNGYRPMDMADNNAYNSYYYNQAVYNDQYTRNYADNYSTYERNQTVPKIKSNRTGRKKITLEYIQNKVKRSVTFSKRKKGLMKKAYELCVLTGAEVCLILANEAGHVYTYATPKFKPLLENKKGAIKTCLFEEYSGTINEPQFEEFNETTGFLNEFKNKEDMNQED
ncbi:SRFB [Hepatospora eriocheir]|uniref:SRFB n=1 Tax=Hepatospora eriocheir TaxID=1081669 RepID=A0A1X0QKN9_9MICR|nr:SRFB [Hepatospora eriocheir]